MKHTLSYAYTQHTERTTAAGGKPMSVRQFINKVWNIIREEIK